jgi:hypothetical protein
VARRGRCLVVLALVAVVSAACGSTLTAAGATPDPAGPHPSPIAVMVCAHKAHGEIDEVLGETSVVSVPTWEDHLYSCEYHYPTGTIGLSVKELSSWSQTIGYYRSLGRQLGKTATLYGLGQGAFRVRNGSIVVRKDWKVLLVDVAALPSPFGVPATSSALVASTVADVILGCWAGD